MNNDFDIWDILNLADFVFGGSLLTKGCIVVVGAYVYFASRELKKDLTNWWNEEEPLDDEWEQYDEYEFKDEGGEA